MSEQTTLNGNQLISVDAAKAKISVALTRLGIVVQSFHTRAAEVERNEEPESLERASKILADKRAAIKAAEDAHKEGKKPFLEAGKAYDVAKNETIKLIEQSCAELESWYNETMAAIERKKRDAEEKRARDTKIKNGIESNVLEFSTRIAACKTRKELVDVERLINLEKAQSRSAKYGEWHEFAIARFNEVLLPIIREQKIKVEEFERLEAEIALASSENNPQRIDELKEKLDEKENEILHNQVKVQEQALNMVVPVSEYAEEVLPDIKKTGSTVVCEIVDEQVVYKKRRELLSVELKVSDAKKLAATLREEGAFDGKDEIIVDGIKFTIERRYK